jgi:hypothetical protein
MERISAVICALVLPVGIFAASPGVAEPAGTKPSQTPAPGYIEAERPPAEEVLGRKLTDEVFSDRFTPLRKRLVAASLRANPAAGCAQPPAFTLETVAPVQATKEEPAWLERYVIKCKDDVRRTFLLLSTKDGMKSAEFAPGGTLADPTLQRDVLQGVMAATIGKAPAKCKGAKVQNTRVASMTRLSEPWTEIWTMDAAARRSMSKSPSRRRLGAAPTGRPSSSKRHEAARASATGEALAPLSPQPAMKALSDCPDRLYTSAQHTAIGGQFP